MASKKTKTGYKSYIAKDINVKKFQSKGYKVEKEYSNGTVLMKKPINGGK